MEPPICGGLLLLRVLEMELVVWCVRRGKSSRHSETIWEHRVSPETPTLLPTYHSDLPKHLKSPLSERLPSHRQSRP
ncbi:hypothetical protein B0T20DRAFT_414005 [Sordaria brevicollis]|uniref:Secreted protein n=1 Tax=Sordaria brevicollis TaxID=83679 RepID=A0AAE0UC38_SORBR|nr:hypothetical protein B0T20DRAFT_414005 [Sordaria brevicollis]